MCWVGQLRQVETRTLIQDDERGARRRQPRGDVYAAGGVRLLRAALVGEFVEVVVAVLAQVGAHFQVAVIDRVQQCLFEGDAGARGPGQVAQSHLDEVVAELRHQRRDQCRVVFQYEL